MQAEDLSSVPRTYVKTPDVSEHQCGRGRTHKTHHQLRSQRQLMSSQGRGQFCLRVCLLVCQYLISTNDTQWAVTKKSMKLEGNGEVGGSGRLRGGMQVNMIKMWCVHAQNSRLIKYYI